MSSSSVQQTPFLKELAANDRPTRDKALTSLRTYLHNRPSLAPLELLKLWKGLFFSMWHSDRPLTQQRLATSLAALLSDLPPTLVLPFLEAFWTTMAREWSGIDVLRMDKFLLLVRQYVAAAWAYFARAGWEDKEQLGEYLDMLGKGPLSPRERKVPDGMRYHVLDIYVDELDKVDEPRSGKVPVELLLRPLRKLEKESPTKSVRERARGALVDERLGDWEGAGVIDGENGGDAREESGTGEWDGFDD